MTSKSGGTARIVCEEWQGGQIPAYNLGARLLAQLAPPGPAGATLHVPVTPPEEATSDDTETVRGVDGYAAVTGHLRAVAHWLAERNPDRIAVLAGDCSVSDAPFDFLSGKYGESLGIVWIDAHPDLWTPSSNSHFNAMAVSALLGDVPEVTSGILAHPVDIDRFHWVGLRAELDPSMARLPAALAQRTTPDELAASPAQVGQALADRGVTRLAVHIDLDSLDPAEFTGLAVPEPDGITFDSLTKLISNLTQTFDIVGITVAEHAPRQLAQLRTLLAGLPLLG
jgi:arginase